MLPFAFSIFAGAFLLFAVQPLVGKYILPWFGGSPGVWTTCLLFFQTLLLGGYLYAHLSATRLTPKRQAALHLVLLALALAMLPIVPSPQWKPESSADPIGRILLLLTVSVGLPYFVLSATGPLMQQWFSLTNPGRSPYRLYALSNAGSLLALLSYPFCFERVLSRQLQATWWSAGLAVFALGCAVCSWRVWRADRAATKDVSPPVESATEPAERPSAADRVLWFSLACVASILLLSTTNKLCQDLAVIPFLWILPLSLYLLSFILCFDHPRWYSRGLFSGLFALGATVDVYLLFAGHQARLAQQIPGYALTLFAGCMLCHGEIFRLRPAPRHLTAFYLHIAAGGAAGAFLVAVVAPLVFDRYLELQIGLWLLSYLVGALAFRHRSRAFAFGTAAGAFAATLVVPALKASAKRGHGSLAAFGHEVATLYREEWALLAFLVAAFLLGVVDRRGWVREWQLRVGNFLMLTSLALGVLLVVQIRRDSLDAITTSRDFYGVLKVFEHNADDADLHYYTLVHGVTSHGLQFAQPPQAEWPTTYYGESSGVGLAIAHLPARRHWHIGLVGLGTGTVASYGRAGDTVRIYEIDPQVERLARSRFSYVTRSPATVDIVMGDARLSMERELARNEVQGFDVLALDAFSSDAIPVHLLTQEAFAVYFRHLKPDGVLAVHTSNRYLDLQPVVEKIAAALGYQTLTISDQPPSKKWWLFRSTWVLVTKNEELIGSEVLRAAGVDPKSPKQVALWTDDYTSVYEILK
jgi:SAM-dependent methyltransferase